jgi:alpha-beta hydrolase superfamily lysophospholipase
VSRLLAVIPGNPGDAVFYGEFVRELQALGHEVTVASHLCLTEPPASLLPYARHQAAAITRHLAATGRTAGDVELVLLGHSVGAYLAYLIVAQGLLPVARVFLLFPFLARPAFSARLILKAVTSRRLFAAFLRLWRVVPRRIARRLIALAGAGVHGSWVEAALASSQALACAAMATTEAAEIAARADAAYLFDEPAFRDPQRVELLLGRRDRWAPQAWSNGQAPAGRRLEEIDHAFVVDPDQCRAVAEAIHRRLS